MPKKEKSFEKADESKVTNGNGRGKNHSIQKRKEKTRKSEASETGRHK